jgi:hypothetical protein
VKVVKVVVVSFRMPARFMCAPSSRVDSRRTQLLRCICWCPRGHDVLKQTNINAVTWQFWVFFGSIVGLTILSVILQQCIKKKENEKKARERELVRYAAISD